MKRKIGTGSLLLLCAALLSGCGDAARDNSEERNPLVRKGLEQAQLKQWSEAIRCFREALDGNPAFARPDLELALIYQQEKKDYVRAIYHYQRYLEKRPDAEKAPLIKDWIEQAKISFAAQIGQAGQSAGDISKEMIRLTRENNLLRQQLARMAAPGVHSKPLPEKQPEKQPEPQPEPTPVSEEPIPRIQTPAPLPETYKVLPGDTLSKIARTVYGDSGKWRDIYGANLDKMENENDLKAGQIITIPPLKKTEPALDRSEPQG